MKIESNGNLASLDGAFAVLKNVTVVTIATNPRLADLNSAFAALESVIKLVIEGNARLSLDGASAKRTLQKAKSVELDDVAERALTERA